MTIAIVESRPQVRNALPWSVLALCAVIVVSPLASGARGLDPALGRTLMALNDAFLVSLFARRLLLQQRLYEVIVTGLLLFCVFQWMFITTYPGIEPVLQGIRKTFLIFIAISVGMDINSKYKNTIQACIAFALIYTAIYGVKQQFIFSDFDNQLLAAQSSNMYSNMISGRQRSISFLSGSFQLGAASSILAAYAVFGPLRSKTSRILLYLVAAGGCISSLTRTFIILLVLVPFLALILRNKKYIPFAIVATLVCVLGVELMTNGGVSDLLTGLVEDKRLGARSSSYERFYNYWLNYPLNMLFGFGVGSAGSGGMLEFAKAGAIWIEPHNIFVKYVFELGLPVGVMAILLFAFTVKESIGRAQEQKWFVFTIVTTLVIAGLTITSVEAWPANWFIGLIIGLNLAEVKEGTLSPQTKGSHRLQ